MIGEPQLQCPGRLLETWWLPEATNPHTAGSQPPSASPGGHGAGSSWDAGAGSAPSRPFHQDDSAPLP